MKKKLTEEEVKAIAEAIASRLIAPVEIDPQELDKARKRMSWAVSFLIVKYHFVYQILGLMNKSCSNHLPTMGVSVHGGGSFELRYNPNFVNTLKDEELTYVLYHEVLHLALHHCTHRRFDDHVLGNIATDLAVNELIPQTPKSCMPPVDKNGKLSGTYVSELKKEKEYSDIREKQTSEWYYDYLRKKCKGKDPSGKGNGDLSVPGEGGGEGNGDGQGSNSNGKGSGKSGKNPLDRGNFDDHGEWKEDEVADEKVRAHIDKINKNNSWGSVDGSAKEIILAAQSRRINWRNILRQFYGNMVWHEKESTRKRPNRRTGYIHPGARKIQLDRHLVAIDTSGSIDSGLLAQFLGTINQMVEYVPIDIMEFDHGVQTQPKPFDRRLKQYNFSGRGGTSFQPVMDVVTERRYKSVVILTDGQAPAPTQPNARIVWCMPTDCKAPVDWGLTIHMTQHD